VSNDKLLAQAADKCEQAGCNEKIQKVHLEQALRGWEAHPPQEFCAWYANHNDYRQGVLARIAWNCSDIRQEYLEAKEHGLT
jgi:hypothetical protein